MIELWRRMTPRQREGWLFNLLSLCLSAAHFSGESAVPFVLPAAATAFSVCAFRTFRKIQKEGP